jgi:hypothetical protein
MLRLKENLVRRHSTKKAICPQREMAMFLFELYRLLSHSFPTYNIALTYHQPLHSRPAINDCNQKEDRYCQHMRLSLLPYLIVHDKFLKMMGKIMQFYRIRLWRNYYFYRESPSSAIFVSFCRGLLSLYRFCQQASFLPPC